MGDFSQSIVDQHVRERDAEDVAIKLLDALIDRGVLIEPEDDDEDEDALYLPGQAWMDACNSKDTEGVDPEELGEVDIAVGRNVYETIENGIDVVCPRCGQHVQEVTEGWMDAVEGWQAGQAATFVCPSCKKGSPIESWDGPTPWGFGNVGITFLNWPLLREGFVAELARLTGHPLRVVRCAY